MDKMNDNLQDLPTESSQSLIDGLNYSTSRRKPTVKISSSNTWLVLGLVFTFSFLAQNGLKIPVSSRPNRYHVFNYSNYENMTFRVRRLVVFESNIISEVDSSSQEEEIRLTDSIDYRLYQVFGDHLASTKYFINRGENKMWVDSIINLRYEKSLVTTSPTRSLVLVLIDGLRNFAATSYIRYKTTRFSLTSIPDGLSTMSITNEYCRNMTKAVENQSYMMLNSTCIECLYNLQGERSTFCNTTISIKYFPLRKLF